MERGVKLLGRGLEWVRLNYSHKQFLGYWKEVGSRRTVKDPQLRCQ